MIVVSFFTSMGSFIYEHKFVKDGVFTEGEIIAFKRKPFSSAQGDPVIGSICLTEIILKSAGNYRCHI